MTNIAVADVANADITSLITESTKELNSLINVHIDREEVSYIDNTRENWIDGVNKTYYVQNWKGKFLADLDDDGSVSTSDIIVYLVDEDGTETTATVSSIDSTLGKFVLTTAPLSGYRAFVTYEWCYKNPATPDPLIKLACILLTSAYCYAKINIGRAPQVAFGNTRIYRHIDSFDEYYNRFLKVVARINSQMADGKDSKLTI